MIAVGHRQPRQAWIDALVELGAIEDADDVRFAAFSLGELATSVLHGTVTSGAIPPAVMPSPVRRADGPAPLARASRRSGVVVVTRSHLVHLRAWSARTRPRSSWCSVPTTEVGVVSAAGDEVEVSLADGSVARFSFPGVAEAAQFVSLW